MITQEQAKFWWKYNPETGIFHCQHNGKLAGTIDQRGRIVLSKYGRKYKAHRIAFLIMTGNIPVEIDHINRIKSDNRWDNLREATRSNNCLNKANGKNNTSGYKNVSPYNNKWKAGITINGKYIHFGTFICKDEAIATVRQNRKVLLPDEPEPLCFKDIAERAALDCEIYISLDNR